MILKILSIFFLLICYVSQKNKNQNEKNIFTYANRNKNIYNIDYLKSLKKVVFTALLGKYDKVHSIIKEKGYDYLMFTDQKFQNITYLNWTILNINNELKYLNMNIIKQQRFFKTHPHFFFKNYDLSIYMDTTFEIKGELDEFLLRILNPNSNIYILEHPERNSINNELKAVVECDKDSNKSVNSVQEKYNEENFPDDNGLAECCLIIRRHNEISCKNFMNSWFEEIKLNSHRDQLSFNYIFWKTSYSGIKYISKNSIEKYFIQYPNHLINYTYKGGMKL